MWRRSFIFWLGIVTGAKNCLAGYVIPYELRLPNDRTPYTALVILPDYFGNDFGAADALDQFMLGNSQRMNSPFITSYRDYLKHWYIAQVTHPSRVQHYGVRSEFLKSVFDEFAPAFDPLTADIVITKYRDLSSVLAMIRATSENAEGVLPEEDVLMKAGKSPRWERDEEPMIGYAPFPDFRLASFRSDSVAVKYPTSAQLRYGPIGGNIAVKNLVYDIEIGKKFLPHVYTVGWLHRIFSVTARLHQGKGVKSSRVYVGCLGESMHALYHWMSYREFLVLNDESTEHNNIYFMKTTPVGLHSGVDHFIRTMYRNQYHANSRYLVYDKGMAKQLRKKSCREFVARGGNA